MGGRMHARDGRYIALYRRGLLARLHLGSDICANGVGIGRQIGLCPRTLAKRLEYRAVRFLGAQRIDRVSAPAPSPAIRARSANGPCSTGCGAIGIGLKFTCLPLGHFHLHITEIGASKIKIVRVVITVIIATMSSPSTPPLQGFAGPSNSRCASTPIRSVMFDRLNWLLPYGARRCRGQYR